MPKDEKHTLWARTWIGATSAPWMFAWTLLTPVFVVYSACWALIEPLLSLVPETGLQGWSKYFAFIGVSLVLGLVCGFVLAIRRHARPSRVAFTIPSTNTTLTILFGDLFGQEGFKAIAVNEFFDSQIGDIISPKSLHGQFIEGQLRGRSSTFNDLVNTDLARYDSDVTSRSQGKKKRYAIGTTAVCDFDQGKYFFVALTRTNLDTHNSSADVPELWQCLLGLWDTVREYAGGHVVNVPLLGGGVSGVGLPDPVLLRLIITSLVNETKKKSITSEVRIILHPDRIESFDLREIQEEWS